jgi:hypothetical protein
VNIGSEKCEKWAFWVKILAEKKKIFQKLRIFSRNNHQYLQTKFFPNKIPDFTNKKHDFTNK